MNNNDYVRRDNTQRKISGERGNNFFALLSSDISKVVYQDIGEVSFYDENFSVKLFR